jgi:hypothetical protein
VSVTVTITINITMTVIMSVCVNVTVADAVFETVTDIDTVNAILPRHYRDRYTEAMKWFFMVYLDSKSHHLVNTDLIEFIEGTR